MTRRAQDARRVIRAYANEVLSHLDSIGFTDVLISTYPAFGLDAVPALASRPARSVYRRHRRAMKRLRDIQHVRIERRGGTTEVSFETYRGASLTLVPERTEV